MKALSLTQPWATLVALGAKRCETRSWSTPYRGELAIHASKGYPRWAQACAHEFRALGYLPPDEPLPLGVVVAIVELEYVKTTEEQVLLTTSEQEMALGDYGPGRYAWMLRLIERVPNIEATGRLGLWDWHGSRALPVTSA